MRGMVLVRALWCNHAHAFRLLQLYWRGFFGHTVANGEGYALANPELFEQQSVAAMQGSMPRSAAVGAGVCSSGWACRGPGRLARIAA